MTIEEHLRALQGPLLVDLMLRVASLAAENDTLKAQLAAQRPPPDPPPT